MDNQLERWLTLVTLAAAALAGVVYLIRQLLAAARVLDRLHTLVDHELTRNGGSSMKDDVAAIAVAVGQLQADVEDIRNDKEAEHRVLHERLDELGSRHAAGTHRREEGRR